MVSPGPEGLSMLVQDAFFVRAPGKGTVLTGHLDGDGQLRVGDYLACDGTTYEVLGIEQFKRVLKEIGSGANAGIALGTAVAKEALAGKTVTFERRPTAGVPALTRDGWVVPQNVAVLVGWSDRRGVPKASPGALVFDGERVALVDQDGTALVEGPGRQVRMMPASSWVGLAAEGSAPLYMIGPHAHLARSPQAGLLITRHKAWVTPDMRLAGTLPWWYRLMVLPNGRILREKLIWRRVLVTMLQSRGVVATPN